MPLERVSPEERHELDPGTIIDLSSYPEDATAKIDGARPAARAPLPRRYGLNAVALVVGLAVVGTGAGIVAGCAWLVYSRIS